MGEKCLGRVERDVYLNMKEKAQNRIQEHREHLPVNLTMDRRQDEGILTKSEEEIYVMRRCL